MFETLQRASGQKIRCKAQRVVARFRSELRRLLDFIDAQRTFTFYSSSLLFVVRRRAVFHCGQIGTHNSWPFIIKDP